MTLSFVSSKVLEAKRSQYPVIKNRRISSKAAGVLTAIVVAVPERAASYQIELPSKDLARR